MSTGDYIPVMGFGAGLGFSLNENINFILNGTYALATEKDDDSINKKKYEYKSYTGGIEYIPPLEIFESNKIYWKNSISAGASDFKLEGKTGGIVINDHQSGVIALFKTGMQYNFTQVLSPFFNIGYHKTFFNTAKTSMSIGGWEVDFGVRLYLFGNRDYESGY